MNTKIKNQKKLIYQVLTPTILSITLLIIGYFYIIDYTRTLLLNENKTQAKEMINSMHSVIDEYYKKVQKGEISEKEAQIIVSDFIYNSRYGIDNKNYFWIINYDQQMISHPYFTSYNALLKTNPDYKKTMNTMSELAQKHGEVFFEYKWQWKDETSRIEVKTSYLKNIPQWSWIIGTGFYNFEVENEIHSLTRYLTLILVSLIFLIAALFVIIVRKAFKDLKNIISSQKDLIKSEKQLRDMANHINSGLAILENNKLIYANSMIFQILDEKLNYNQEFSIYDYCADEEVNRIKNYKNSIYKEEKSENAFWIVTHQNNRKYISNRFTNYYKDNKKFSYVLISDITETILKEDQLKTLSQTVDQSPDSIVMTDLEGNIIYVNKTFCKVSGYEYDEVIGQKPRIMKSNKMDPRVYTDLWKSVTQGKLWKRELLNKKKDGTLYWEYTIVFPIKDEEDNIIYYAAVKRDLTQQKLFETELKLAKEKADIGVNIKNAFLSNVSHEVNTPLNVISGFSNILLNEIENPSTHVDYLNNIKNNADILLKLFKDIMDYTAIESGNVVINKDEISLTELLHNVKANGSKEISTLESQKTLTINIKVDENFRDAIFISDIDWISRILNELITNAIKFSNTGEISIGYKIDYENITFFVSDQGVGIPEKEQDKVFDKFIHGNKQYVSLHKGTGLGLSIVKLITEKLDGRVWFESTEDVGTTFFFSFSSIHVKNYSIDNLFQSDFPFAGLLKGENILVLEDNDANFEHIRNMFIKEDASLSRAMDANEFIHLIRHNDFNLCIVDYTIACTGFGNFETSINETHKTIPIIFMVKPDIKTQEISMLNMHTTITKPFQKNNLFALIAEIIENTEGKRVE